MKMSSPDDLPYRPCVGMMILNSNGLVWVGKRKKRPNTIFSKDVSSFLWQMPQGGIDEGEEPLAAAKREIYEETGMKSLKLLSEIPSWLFYNIPPDSLGRPWKGKYKGQMQKWFAFYFSGLETEISIESIEHEQEFDSWAWKPMRDLPDLVVPFKRDVYIHVVETFTHLEQYCSGCDSKME